MSGAEPWIGSYTPSLPAPSDAEGSKPSEPASIDASSVRMSPNMFSVTITSKLDGLRIRCIAAESTSMCSSSTSGNSARSTDSTVVRHRREVSSTLALSTDTMRLRRALREPAGDARDALNFIDAVRAQVAGEVLGAAFLAEVDAARQLAHDHDVGAAQDFRLER